MSTIDDAFQQASADVKTLSEDPGDQAKLKLYAYFKQATSGDVSGSRPGLMNFVGRAKYDAWAELKGVAQDDAKQRYVDFVNSLKS